MILVGECLTMTTPERAEAVYIEGDRILDVGEARDVRSRHPGAPRIEVEMVTPGVHDAHVHPLYWGRSLEELDLSGVTEPDEAAMAVAGVARTVAPGTWIRGGGYVFDHYPDSRLLDEAAPANPVFLSCRDLHSGWASRRAFVEAGISAATPDPEGGVIVRTATGEPAGYLLERALTLVESVLPPPGPADLERGLADLARRGYTAAHVMAYEQLDALRWAELLASRGSLPLRLWWALPRGQWEGTAPGARGACLDVAAVKFFLDGSLGSRTAWMEEPYPDGSRGLALDAVETIREEGARALAAGFGLAVHAIGTQAVAAAVSLAGGLAGRGSRGIRVEHVQHVTDSTVEALGSTPVALSMQPSHLPGDMALIRSQTPGREGQAFRFRSLLGTGRPLAFGSDAPVVAPDLAAGIAAATGHPFDPGESLTFEEAVRAFTRGAALAAGWGGEGILVPGARADLGLWEQGTLVGRVFGGDVEWLTRRGGGS